MIEQQIINFTSEKDIECLINFYESSNNVIIKSTGPKVLDITHIIETLCPDIIYNLKGIYGDFSIRNAHIFDVTMPHIIHNDIDASGSDCYYGFTLPLALYGNYITYPKLIMFDQSYREAGVKLVKGENISDKNIHYNTLLNDYSEISDISNNEFPIDYKDIYLPHIKHEWLRGLSLYCDYDWIPGSVMSFDTARFHCASDFRTMGVDRKLGLAIFTRY